MDTYTIYRIRDKTTGETYIGSTKMELDKRLKIHIRNKDCKSMKILKNNNYVCSALLLLKCSKETALWLERFSMKNHYKVVNKIRSIRTREEVLREMRDYNKNNREKHNEYNRKWNNEKRAKKQSINCPCGGHYKPHVKSRHFKSKKHINYFNLKKSL